MTPPFSIFTVYGTSMEPTLKSGQKLLAFNWGNFKEGDMVAVQNGQRLIVKRIQKIQGKEIYLLGDNPNQSTDSRRFGWVKKSQVKGKIIWYH